MKIACFTAPPPHRTARRPRAPAPAARRRAPANRPRRHLRLRCALLPGRTHRRPSPAISGDTRTRMLGHGAGNRLGHAWAEGRRPRGRRSRFSLWRVRPVSERPCPYLSPPVVHGCSRPGPRRRGRALRRSGGLLCGDPCLHVVGRGHAGRAALDRPARRAALATHRRHEDRYPRRRSDRPVGVALRESDCTLHRVGDRSPRRTSGGCPAVRGRRRSGTPGRATSIAAISP